MEAWATMFYGANMSSSPSFSGLRALVSSIRLLDGLRPIVVLTTPETAARRDRAAAALEEANAPLSWAPVDPPAINNRACIARLDKKERAGTQKQAGMRDMFIKLAVWNLTQYSRVLYVDADALVLRPLDELWAVPLASTQIAAAAMAISAKPGRAEHPCAAGHKVWGTRKYNAGVLLVRPSSAVHATALLALSRKGGAGIRFDCADGDQHLFNVLARPRTRCVGQTYNCRDPTFLTTQGWPSAHADRFSRCLQPGEPPRPSPERRNLNGTDSAQALQGAFPPSQPGAYQHGGSLAPGAQEPPLLPHVIHFAMTTKPWLDKHRAWLQPSSCFVFYRLWAHALTLTRARPPPAPGPRDAAGGAGWAVEAVSTLMAGCTTHKGG